MYCTCLSSKKEENTVMIFGEAGREDQYLKIAVAESVFLWNFTKRSWNWRMLSFNNFLIVFYSSNKYSHVWYKSTALFIVA